LTSRGSSIGRLIRWERHFEVYRRFFVLALLLICVRRVSAA
jgi:hypothetical protein